MEVEGGCAVFEHKTKSEEKEPADATMVKKKGEERRKTARLPRFAALSVGPSGRSLARSDLDGRGGEAGTERTGAPR